MVTKRTHSNGGPTPNNSNHGIVIPFFGFLGFYVLFVALSVMKNNISRLLDLFSFLYPRLMNDIEILYTYCTEVMYPILLCYMNYYQRWCFPVVYFLILTSHSPLTPSVSLTVPPVVAAS